VSNAFTPVGTLPSFARDQPVSIFDNALRALTQGPAAAHAALGHSTSYFVLASVAWSAALAALVSRGASG